MSLFAENHKTRFKPGLFGLVVLLHALVLLAAFTPGNLPVQEMRTIEFSVISPLANADAPARKPAGPAIAQQPPQSNDRSGQTEKSMPAMPKQPIEPAAETGPVQMAMESKPAKNTTASQSGQSGPSAETTKLKHDTGQSSPTGNAGAKNRIGSPSGSNRLDEYLAEIRSRVESYKEYPSSARQMGDQGTATVRVTIMANGNLGSVTVIKSSGHRALDRSAVNAVKNAAPFKPAAGYGLSGTTVEIPISYRLN